MEMSVLERQRFSLKWQQNQLQVQQQDQNCFNEANIQSMLLAQAEYFYGIGIKTDPVEENSWIDFRMPNNNGLASESSEFQYTSEVNNHSYLREMANVTESKGRELITRDQKLSGETGRQSFKKRKAEKTMPPKDGAERDSNSKKSKACIEEEGSKIASQKSNKKSNSGQNNQKESHGNKNDKKNREISGCTSSEDHKLDYIHVRARRGQATDSHSLAERVRREKISERMKHLQDLVPGCNKIIGKAGMLDEIINYVQSLQRQVEFLSMKLAAVNPTFDFSIDDLIAKQVLAICSTSMSTIGAPPDMTNTNYLQYNPIQQSHPFYGYEVAEDSMDSPLPVQETFIDPSRFNQNPSTLPWDAELQNICRMEFQQERYTSSQAFTGNFEASSLKMEM